MDVVDVTPFNPFPTAPRGPWCDARTRFTHYGPVDYRAASSPPPPPPGVVDIPSLPSPTGPVAILVEIEQSKPTLDRATPPRQPPQRTTAQQPKSARPADHARASPKKPRDFTFTEPDPSTRKSFTFSAQLPVRPRLKRARTTADVDGPNTATLSCKKRRLRLALITSRLSQPFSLPATHILNREALAAGDKRFLKMATHVEMVRRGWAPGGGGGSHSASSFRRFALLNMTRSSLEGCNWTQLGGYLSCRGPAAADKGRPATPVANNTRAPSSLLVPPPKSVPRPPPSSPSPPRLQSLPCALASRQQQQPTTKPVSSPPSPLGRRAESVERSASEKDAEQRRRSVYDEDDDCEAFPDSLYDSSDDPEEDVYSDFGAIFDASPQTDEDPHSFEEYLDELDGISWAVR